MLRNKIIISVMSLSIAFIISTGNNALADQKCKSVKIKIKNSFKAKRDGLKIKVMAIQYFDKEDMKWRLERLPNAAINFGKSKTFRRDLQYVGNEWVQKIQVKFKYKEADGDWSDVVWSNVTVFPEENCVKNKTYKVTVNKKMRKK